MSLEPSEILGRLRRCLSYRLDGPYIVVLNKCGESIDIDAVEIKYYITVRVEEEGVTGARSARKEITERISLRKRVSPGGSVEVYFGPTENIVSVLAVVDYGGGKYRVELSRERQAQQEGSGSAE